MKTKSSLPPGTMISGDKAFVKKHKAKIMKEHSAKGKAQVAKNKASLAAHIKKRDAKV